LATSPSALEHVEPVRKTLTASGPLQSIQAQPTTNSSVLEQAQQAEARDALDSVVNGAMGIVGERVFLPKPTAILCASAPRIEPRPA